MKIIIIGKNMEVSADLKQRAEKKLAKLDKYFKEEVEANVNFEKIKNRQILEITVMLPKTIIRAEEESDDFYNAIDRAIDVLERQIRKNKTKIAHRLKGTDTIRTDFLEESIPEEKEENDEKLLVKRKRFTVKPMTTDEAILQMDLLHHNFFVYVSSETDQVEIVYKRKDGNYGLIEPII